MSKTKKNNTTKLFRCMNLTSIKCIINANSEVNKLRPVNLNKQLNSQSNYDIKTLIIAAYPQFRKNDGKHSEVDRP